MKKYDMYYKNIAYLESLGNVENQKNYHGKYKNPQIFIKRFKYFLKILKNPQNKIKRYIHIGGTSGKGSVANYIHNIISCAGKKSFLFTSPFLTETIEKYKINTKLISVKQFNCLMENHIKPAINICAQKSPYGLPSYFEICFSIAILAYLENKCECFVSEVGLGGEYDATNIVKKKILTIITHVDLDHTEILGNTKTKIATTKSKIITSKSIFLTNEKNKKIIRIFKDECHNKKTYFNHIKTNNITINYKNKSFKYKNQYYRINTYGKHQAENAILAIEACKKLNINNDFIKIGLKKTKLPGKFEIINTRPLIVLDVAHNPDKISTTLDNLKNIKYNKLHIIYGSAADKNTQKIANLLSKYVDNLIITKYYFSLRPCANPKYLYSQWRKTNKNLPININLDPWNALEKTIANVGKNDLILIAGSFFLVGELRKKWWDSLKILKEQKII